MLAHKLHSSATSCIIRTRMPYFEYSSISSDDILCNHPITNFHAPQYRFLYWNVFYDWHVKKCHYAVTKMLLCTS